MNETRSYMTREEAAKYLGVSKSTLHAWASKGKYKIPYTNLGREAIYNINDLQAFLASQVKGV